MTNLQTALCERAPVPASYLYWRFAAVVLVIAACVVGQFVGASGDALHVATSLARGES